MLKLLNIKNKIKNEKTHKIFKKIKKIVKNTIK